MRHFSTLLLTLLFTIQALTQNFKGTLTPEFKVDRGSSTFNIVFKDETGYYFLDGKVAARDFVVVASIRMEYALIKYDINGKIIYEKSYKKELKGLGLHSIQVIKNEIYLIAQEYDTKEKTLALSGAQLDKNTGELRYELKPMGNWNYDPSRNDNINIAPTSDGESLLVKVNLERAIAVSIYSPQLKKEKGVYIRHSFDIERFLVDDVNYDKKNNLVAVVREFDVIKEKGVVVRRKVKKCWIYFYDEQGKKIKELERPFQGKFLTGCFFIRKGNEDPVIMSQYTTDSARHMVLGIVWIKINLATGTITDEKTYELGNKAYSNYTELLGYRYDDITGKFIFFLEYQRQTEDRTTTFDHRTMIPQNRVDVLYTEYYNEIVLLLLNGQNGNPEVVQVNKAQVETNSGSGHETSLYSSASLMRLTYKEGLANFASYKYLIKDGKAYLLFNDNPLNANIQDGKVKAAVCEKYSNTAVYGVTINLNNLQVSRKEVFPVDEKFAYKIPNQFHDQSGFYIFSRKWKISGKHPAKIASVKIE